MANNFGQSTVTSYCSFFSDKKLKRDALLEHHEGNTTNQSSDSSQGRNALTPYNDKASASYRYFLFLKNQDIDTLANILSKEPSVAEMFLKHLLKNPSLELKSQLLSSLAKKLDFSELLRAKEETLADIQKIIPQSFTQPLVKIPTAGLGY